MLGETGYTYSAGATSSNTWRIPDDAVSVLAGLSHWTLQAQLYFIHNSSPAQYFTGAYTGSNPDYNQIVCLTNSENFQAYYHSLVGGASSVFTSTGFYNVSAEWDGTHFKVWVNGTSECNIACATNEFGVGGMYWYILTEYNIVPNTGDRINKLIIDDQIMGGVEITPVPNATLTFTPTFTLTPNATQTYIVQQTQTANASATNAAIATETATWWTPTAQCTITPCNQAFTPILTPVLRPTRIEEGGINGSVQEPNVILGPDGLLHMTATINLWGNEEIALYTSPDGINWTWYRGNCGKRTWRRNNGVRTVFSAAYWK